MNSMPATSRQARFLDLFGAKRVHPACNGNYTHERWSARWKIRELGWPTSKSLSLPDCVASQVPGAGPTPWRGSPAVRRERVALLGPAGGPEQTLLAGPTACCLPQLGAVSAGQRGPLSGACGNGRRARIGTLARPAPDSRKLTVQAEPQCGTAADWGWPKACQLLLRLETEAKGRPAGVTDPALLPNVFTLPPFRWPSGSAWSIAACCADRAAAADPWPSSIPPGVELPGPAAAPGHRSELLPPATALISRDSTGAGPEPKAWCSTRPCGN